MVSSISCVCGYNGHIYWMGLLRSPVVKQMAVCGMLWWEALWSNTTWQWKRMENGRAKIQGRINQTDLKGVEFWKRLPKRGDSYLLFSVFNETWLLLSGIVQYKEWIHHFTWIEVEILRGKSSLLLFYSFYRSNPLHHNEGGRELKLYFSAGLNS